MSVPVTFEVPKPTPVMYLVFSIRDVKTVTYNTPFFQTHKAGAMRMFSDLCNDPQSTISRHPEDFQLFLLGMFNSETAEYTPLSTPEYLASPADFRQ